MKNVGGTTFFIMRVNRAFKKKGKKKMKEKIKHIKTNDLEDLNEFYEIIEQVKDFDLYIIFLMVKNELLKRGYKCL